MRPEAGLGLICTGALAIASPASSETTRPHPTGKQKMALKSAAHLVRVIGPPMVRQSKGSQEAWAYCWEHHGQLIYRLSRDVIQDKVEIDLPTRGGANCAYVSKLDLWARYFPNVR
jgi:hypothetical protein